MPVIKEIIQNDKDKNCVTVITEEKSFTLNKEVCIGERIYAGKILSDEEINNICGENQKKLALNKALTYISRKKCSVKMMMDYLSGKGFEESASLYAVGRLKEYRYIDDEGYAASFVNSATGNKGRLKIAYELKNKGISQDLIQKYNKDDNAELTDCIMLAKKFVKNNDINDIKIRQKLIRHLLYKGFEYDTVLNAVNAIKDGEDFET